MTSSLLQVPLSLKLVGANGVLVAGTAVLAAVLESHEAHLLHASVTAALVGLAVSVPINWLLVRVALSPLAALQRTAERVRAGNLDDRAPGSPVADSGMRRLIEVFNGMLQRLVQGQQTLRRLSVGVLEAGERERRSLASELQEDTAQRVAALLLRVELARKAIVGEKESCQEAKCQLEHLRDEATESLELIRLLARRLHPPELIELGLVPALRAHARTVSDQAGLSVEVEVHGSEPVLEPEVELAIYRIAEEALLNAIRHAGAERIVVRMDTGDDDTTLSVMDDGRGFEPALVSSNGDGVGLLGMRERALAAGGSMVVLSEPGAGSRIVVTVPSARRPPPLV